MYVYRGFEDGVKRQRAVVDNNRISDYPVYSFPEKCVHLYPDSRSALTPSDSLAVSGLVTAAAATPSPSTQLQWSAPDTG